MFSKGSLLFKSLVYTILLTFPFNSTVFAENSDIDTLSPPLLAEEQPFTDDSADFRESVLTDWPLVTVFFDIADFFLQDDGDPGELVETFRRDFGSIPGFLQGQIVSLGGISLERGIVTVPFEMDDNRGEALLADASQAAVLKEDDPRWTVVDRYVILVKPRGEEVSEDGADLRGAEAQNVDPVIEALIRTGKVVEVYIDAETDKLKANRVKFVDGYRPLLTPKKLFLGNEVSIGQLFDATQKKNIEGWIRSHTARGSPVRFRMVLGASALGWDTNEAHINIAHAGIVDGVIYIGGLLLTHLFKDGQEDLRHELLDKDEYLHLVGLKHAKGLEERIRRVKAAIEETELEEIRRNMLKKNPYSLKEMIAARLADTDRLLDFFSIVNDIALSQPLYPVESTYPIKQAVGLLSSGEQAVLKATLQGQKSRDEGYIGQIVISDILLMLEEEAVAGDWIGDHAPELEGRTLWQVSPEIWHEAGGLARVMQYHGAGIHELIGQSNVKLKHLEPHYQYKINAAGEAVPLDYAKDLTHQVTYFEEDGGAPYRTFTVDMHGKEVKAEVRRGVNTLGIEVWMIRDVQEDGESYYTHSLYNYKDRAFPGEDPHIPTWEEFSVFYSKAVMTLLTLEAQKEISEQGEGWKAPVVHLNDSQTALVSVYRKIQQDEYAEIAEEEADEPAAVQQNEEWKARKRFLDECVMCMTTHTYNNRKDYRLQTGYGDRILASMDVPVEYRELFKHWKGDEGDVYDMASGGLRAADWQGAVAKAHRDDVTQWDEWVNTPTPGELRGYYDRMGVDFNLVAVSNGDHRSKTRTYFRRIMEELYGDTVDVEHPDSEQVARTKKTAKGRLVLSSGPIYSSADGEITDGSPFLRDDQIVISYSGRLVREKAGRGFKLDGKGNDGRGAFDDRNIEELVKQGAQVVIYGNVQSNNPNSEGIAAGLIGLTRTLNGKGYPGRLIFAPRFSLNEQRALLAASDVQVQDSYPSTEAAGFTEADISVTGGIEVGTLRTDNEVGEGLFQAQGYPMDLSEPGKGNTLTPKTLDAAGYLEVLLKLKELYDSGNLKHYQATSIRLSRTLEARLTSAAYLREFSRAVAEKRGRERVREIRAQEKKKEKEARTLLRQMEEVNKREDPEGYAVYSISRKVLEGEMDSALLEFFTGEAFQNRRERLSVPVRIFNKLLDAARRDPGKTDRVIEFAKKAGISAVEYADKPNELRFDHIGKAVRVIAAVSAAVATWQKEGVDGAAVVRLTDDDMKMVQSSGMNTFVDEDTLDHGLEEKMDRLAAEVSDRERSSIPHKEEEGNSLGHTAPLNAFIEDNVSFLARVLGKEAKTDKLVRIPIELVDIAGEGNLKGLLGAIQESPHGYVELYSINDPVGITDRPDLVKKSLPDSLKRGNRTRANTVTVFPAFKGETLPASEVNRRWKLGGMKVGNTIVSPIGYNYDLAGLVRSIFLGLRLAEIAGNDSYNIDSPFVSYTLAQYMSLSISQGIDPGDFDLTGHDLIDIARGEVEQAVSGLNKLLRLLPIMPYNIDELKEIYEQAREALIRA